MKRDFALIKHGHLFDDLLDVVITSPADKDLIRYDSATGTWINIPGSTYVAATRTLTAGAGLTGGGDLSADRTFDVGAGTGITVNANDVAINAAYLGANPTATIGLSVINGTSTNYMRADAAPPLSQAIGPTWTGLHTFTLASNAYSLFYEPAAGTDAKYSMWRSGGSGVNLSSSADATPTTASRNATSFVRTGLSWSSMSFGNATDNPTYSFLGTGAATFGGVILAPDGAVGAPAYSFSGDTDTGIYHYAANAIGIATGGVIRIYVDNSITQIVGQVQFADGAVGTPSISFASDTDTGLYRIGANQMGMAVGGTGEDITATSSTFTFTITGCTTSPTGTGRYVKHGNLVVLFIPTITATSNATTLTFTGLPAAIQLARTQYWPIPTRCMLDNGLRTTDNRIFMVASSGTVTFQIAASSSGWTNSGSKGVSEEFVVSYLLT
jgi:hypothetical protein